MPRFRFSLASVLKMRESVRDERRAQLAEAFLAAETLDARLAAAEAAIQDVRRRHAVPAGPVQVDRLLEASRYEAVLEQERLQMIEQRRLVTAEVERRRLVLVAAERDVRSLELLEGRQSQMHNLAEQRREVRVQNEIALVPHLHQSCDEC